MTEQESRKEWVQRREREIEAEQEARRNYDLAIQDGRQEDADIFRGQIQEMVDWVRVSQ